MTKVSRVSTVKFIQKGETGKPGPLLYPAGPWIKTTAYTRTESTAPFVLYDTGNPDTDVYYYLNKEGTFTGIDPKSDYQTNGKNATWIQFENYNAIYAKILMADFALIAGAVAHKNKLFSQTGTINGEPSNAYANENFMPNLSLDWLNGKMECYAGSFAGYIKTPFVRLDDADCTKVYLSEDGKDGYKLNNNLNIYTSERKTIILPIDEAYAGSHVKIFNTCFSRSSRVSGPTFIQVEGREKMTGFRKPDDVVNVNMHPYEVLVGGAMLEFIGIPGLMRDGSKYCYWHCTNYNSSMSVYLYY